MDVNRGFRDTDAGRVPVDWDVKPLREVLLRARLGGNYPNEAVESENPLIKMGNIGRGQVDTSKIEYIPSAVVPEPQHLLRTGDVLFNTRNTLDLVGKVAMWRDELPRAYYNSNLMRLEFNPEIVCSNAFANASLNTRSAISALRGLATGTTSVAAIYTRDLMEFPFVTPPLAEQLAIAEALGDVDGLLAGLDRLIAKKRDLKQATMQQLLTGQTRLPGFAGEWEVKRLGTVGKCLRGVSYQSDTDLAQHDAIDTKRLLRSNNVQDGNVVTHEVQFVRSTRVNADQILKVRDILICIANGSKDLVGKAGLFMVADGYPYTFGAFMGCFRTNVIEADPAFVFHLFQTQRYRHYISNLLAGSSINNLRPRSIEFLEFPMPSLPEQRSIAAVLSDIAAEIAALETRRDKTRALKQGMMQELLSGRTRLV